MIRMAVVEVELKGDSISESGADNGDGVTWNRERKGIFEEKVTGFDGILIMIEKRMLANMTLNFWLIQPNAWKAVLWDKEGDRVRERGAFTSSVLYMLCLYCVYDIHKRGQTERRVCENRGQGKVQTLIYKFMDIVCGQQLKPWNQMTAFHENWGD